MLSSYSLDLLERVPETYTAFNAAFADLDQLDLSTASGDDKLRAFAKYISLRDNIILQNTVYFDAMFRNFKGDITSKMAALELWNSPCREALDDYRYKVSGNNKFTILASYMEFNHPDIAAKKDLYFDNEDISPIKKELASLRAKCRKYCMNMDVSIIQNPQIKADWDSIKHNYIR